MKAYKILKFFEIYFISYGCIFLCLWSTPMHFDPKGPTNFLSYYLE